MVTIIQHNNTKKNPKKTPIQRNAMSCSVNHDVALNLAGLLMSLNLAGLLMMLNLAGLLTSLTDKTRHYSGYDAIHNETLNSFCTWLNAKLLRVVWCHCPKGIPFIFRHGFLRQTKRQCVLYVTFYLQSVPSLLGASLCWNWWTVHQYKCPFHKTGALLFSQVFTVESCNLLYRSTNIGIKHKHTDFTAATQHMQRYKLSDNNNNNFDNSSWLYVLIMYHVLEATVLMPR